ncbi:hypothetical protein [Mesorhizobium sp.]|nr:hypothetical protein [Mesorhizobium sp.]
MEAQSQSADTHNFDIAAIWDSDNQADANKELAAGADSDDLPDGVG